MNFEFNNNVPIYVQIVEQLKVQIISGKIKSGDRLPSVRELALMLKVNPNTLQKALQELEAINLIYTERTNGKFVTDNQELINKYKNEYALELSTEYLDNMKQIEFELNDTIDYLKELGGKV